MGTSETVVLDASVVTKWHLQTEEFGQQALALRQAFIHGWLAVILPEHARYEVANAINVACTRGRLEPAQAATAIRDSLEWHFTFVGSDDLILSAFTFAQRVGCALYDGLYLALAEEYGVELVTADAALYRKLAGSAPWVKWIGDYQIA